MYETYPKPSKHPCMSKGEQEDGDWNEKSGGTKSYVTNNGAKDTDYNGDKSKTLSLEGGSGSKNGTDYPKKRTTFGTEE